MSSSHEVRLLTAASSVAVSGGGGIWSHVDWSMGLPE